MSWDHRTADDSHQLKFGDRNYISHLLVYKKFLPKWHFKQHTFIIVQFLLAKHWVMILLGTQLLISCNTGVGQHCSHHKGNDSLSSQLT